jgi:hypothetical protein
MKRVAAWGVVVSTLVASATAQFAYAVGPVQLAGRLCFGVVGDAGDIAVLNLTPVLAAGAGNGQLVSSDVATAPVASNVNFGPGTVDPNVAMAQIGVDGRVCFVNSQHSDVDLVADQLGTIRASAFVLPGPTGAPSRRADTRPVVSGTALTSAGSGLPLVSDIECPSEQSCVGAGEDADGVPVFIASGDGGRSWSGQRSGLTNARFGAVACASQLLCFATGALLNGDEPVGGVVMRTANGGGTWTQSLLPTNIRSVASLSCWSTTKCIAVGASNAYSGVALSTPDAGLTWSTLYESTGMSGPMAAISCVAGGVCTVSASGSTSAHPSENGGVVLRTDDEGQHWSENYRTLEDIYMTDIDCFAQAYCLIAGLDYSEIPSSSCLFCDPVTFMLASTDGGLTWEEPSSQEFRKLLYGRDYGADLECLSAGRCIATGGGGHPGGYFAVYESLDLLYDWKVDLLPMELNGLPLSFTFGPFSSAISCPAEHTCYVAGGMYTFDFEGVVGSPGARVVEGFVSKFDPTFAPG